MSILKSKKVIGLQEENKELKAQVRRLYEKEETVNRLNDILKNMRSEIMEAKNEKARVDRPTDYKNEGAEEDLGAQQDAGNQRGTAGEQCQSPHRNRADHHPE